MQYGRSQGLLCWLWRADEVNYNIEMDGHLPLYPFFFSLFPLPTFDLMLKTCCIMVLI